MAKKKLHIYYLQASTRTCEKYTRMSGTSCKKITWSQNQKQRIQLRGTTFANLSDEVTPHRGQENCCPLCHTAVSAPKSLLQGGILGSTLQLELWQNYGASYWKKITGRSASRCRFDRRFSKYIFLVFDVGDATYLVGAMFYPHACFSRKKYSTQLERHQKPEKIYLFLFRDGERRERGAQRHVHTYPHPPTRS